MKTVKFLFSVIAFMYLCCIAFFTSCNPKEQLNFTGSNSAEQIAIDELINSIDLLNTQYPSAQTKGAFATGGCVGLADAAGWAAGGCIGRWAGGAIGSLGGPATAVVGHLIGGKVGPYICTFLASGAANLICSRMDTRANEELCGEFQVVGIITVADSIGYYHNCMMAKLAENKIKYVNHNGTVNYDLIYNDILLYFREIGKYDAALENEEIKAAIINQIKDLCTISERHSLSPDSEEFIAEQCQYLKTKCMLTDDDIKLYKEFNVKIFNKCATLSEAQIVDYSQNLNDIISESNLSQTLKEDLKETADLTINSSMCWQANY